MMNKSSKIFVATGDRSSQQRLGGFTKALLRGSVSGRYEDLRGFIHHLETADGFLFIEDLNVGRHSTKKGEAIAFQITLSTYIREGPGQRVSSHAFLP